jgi:hypothetical protein
MGLHRCVLVAKGLRLRICEDRQGRTCARVVHILKERLELPAAEARKAEGASMTKLQIPKPPFFTEREV